MKKVWIILASTIYVYLAVVGLEGLGVEARVPVGVDGAALVLLRRHGRSAGVLCARGCRQMRAAVGSGRC